MPISSGNVYKQIRNITSKLISLNLSVEQNFPSKQQGNISYSGCKDISVALKNIAYEEIYKTLEESKNYNIKMIDGALIHFLYNFELNQLRSHRLAFFPAPNLESFQNEPELYEDDEIYTDILDKNIVTFPVRFDYDPANFQELDHPKSHVTFGQYKNCRIPVSEPLTPNVFINFILRNFYNTAFHKVAHEIPSGDYFFDKTITKKEQKILHLGIY